MRRRCPACPINHCGRCVSERGAARHSAGYVSARWGIGERPTEADERQEAGHWEIDLVVGGKDKGATVLLTLTERKTRKLMIRKFKDRSQKAVVRTINGLERQMGAETFRLGFKSITADNGSEFLDRKALERSVSGGDRTHIYYAHPYSSWKRGNNENANRIIRHFIPNEMRYLEVYPETDPGYRGLDQQLSAQDIEL